MRLEGEIATPNSAGPEVAVLAVSEEAGDLLWWREDFAERTLDAILDRVDSGDILRGVPIPPASAELSVWVNPELQRATVTVWARVRDAHRPAPPAALRQARLPRLARVARLLSRAAASARWRSRSR